ncbi:uncharacterized protein [Primulina eburnea]|uniref:uncharacterized protein n=1 Tax=Primulina eburnea TaxID=1245227 RepID=UPI003C6CA506
MASPVEVDGPLKILKPNPAVAITEGAPQMLEKPRYEWTSEDKKKANLDNVAKDILYKTLDKNTFSKIKMCHTAKEIWEKLIQICEGNEETKENKLSVAMQKFENMKIKAGETMNEFDERFSSLVNELSALGKDFGNREIVLKVMRALPREWDVKTMAMRASRDLNKLELYDLFSDLKAYEFELEVRSGEEPLEIPPTKALVATVNSTATVAPSSSSATAIESTSERSVEQISNDAMSLFIKKFLRFMRKNHRTFQSPNRNFKKESPSGDMACFNCGKVGHFIADCPKPKKDDQKKKGVKRNDKKTRRDRKAMIAEESKSKWADSSSESSGSESHSSDSDEDEIKCLMANTESTSTSGEVFDFDYDEFTRTDLVKALHDMKLSLLVNAWNKSSISLEKMQELQKQSGDKSGLEFCNDEGTSETNTKPKLDMCKEKYIHFVKSSVVQVKKAKIRSSTWYLDSGCSRHMTGQKILLSEIVSCAGPEITFGDNSKDSSAPEITNISNLSNKLDRVHLELDSEDDAEARVMDIQNPEPDILMAEPAADIPEPAAYIPEPEADIPKQSTSLHKDNLNPFVWEKISSSIFGDWKSSSSAKDQKADDK